MACCLLDANAQSLPKLDPITPQLNTSAVTSTERVVISEITLKGLSIVGATIFKPEILQALVSDFSSGSHTLVELQAATSKITQYYRSAGYFLAHAYLPAQKLEDGVITISVLEGKLAETRVGNSSRLSDEVVRTHLSDLTPGSVLNRSVLDRSLLLLGDLPGVDRVDSRFVPGPSSGETILVTVLTPAPAWTGRLEADNFGSLFSGRYRLGASVDGNSPSGHGERLAVSVLASDANLAYGRAAIQAPLGASGMALATGFTHSQYSLADIYKSLDAVGQSDALEANVRYPLVRSVPFNLYGQGSLEHRKVRDEVRSTNTLTDKDASVVSLSLQADWHDNVGGLNANNQASITVTRGRLHISSASAVAIDAVAANTAGDYNKVTFSARRQQGLAEKWSVSGHLLGQWANKNLDSSEKFSLGGASGVRAYPSGEASGDKGWMGSVELRYSVLPNLTASLFYDSGSISVNVKPYLATSNKRSLAASGIGLAGNYAAFDWRITAAWRDGEPARSEPDRSPRVWAQAGVRF